MHDRLYDPTTSPFSPERVIEAAKQKEWNPQTEWRPSIDWYTGNLYDIREVIEDFNLNFNLGNVLKYVTRAGKKPGTTRLQDLRKARLSLDREIEVEALKEAGL